MKQYSNSIRVASVLAAFALSALTVSAQAPGGGAPGAGAPGGAAGGARAGGAIPGITAEQTAKINELFTTGLQAETAAVTAARAELATATFMEKRDDNAIKAAVAKVQAAELALANKRAAAFATLQGSAEKLNPEQVTAFVAAGGTLGGGAGGRGGAGGGGGGARGGAGGGAPGGAPGGAAPARGN
jgi:Spy/CpxP family protein refolding chaperone